MAQCPCGTALSYTACCGLYIDSGNIPNTAEALMRSRYSAYTQAKISYIKRTMFGKAMLHFNAGDAKRWARRVQWMGLNVINTFSENENKAFVEFRAIFKEGNALHTIHEVSEFHRMQGVWYYVDGVQR